MLVKAFESAKTDAEILERSDVVVTAVKEGKLSLHNTSLLDIAEATLGVQGMRSLRETPQAPGFSVLKESVAPVNLTAFSNITGQLIYQGVYEQYARPEFIGDQLVTAETSREDNTRVPGIAPIDDDAMTVEEGGEFPDVKFGEDYIDIPKSEKRGLKIGVTREMVFFDRTGQVLEMARTVGERLGMNKEKRILQVVLGITNTYTRKGVAANTYLTSGNRINEIVNVLTDWTSLDAEMQAFYAMRDDRTKSEPIMVRPTTMLVSPYKMLTAKRILSATEVRSTSGSMETITANPVSGSMSVLSSPYFDWLLTKTVADGGLNLAGNVARDYWYCGEFKRAFRYRTLFPMQVLTASNDKDSFERDVVAQFRADERGVAYTYAPWYVIRNKPA